MIEPSKEEIRKVDLEKLRKHKLVLIGCMLDTLKELKSYHKQIENIDLEILEIKKIFNENRRTRRR